MGTQVPEQVLGARLPARLPEDDKRICFKKKLKQGGEACFNLIILHKLVLLFH